MSKLLELLKGARKIELFLLAVATAILLMLSLKTVQPDHTQTELERRLAAILERVEGVGNADVMVTENPDGSILGVLVVADGAENISVRLRLQYAVQTLLDANASIIEIVQSAR